MILSGLTGYDGLPLPIGVFRDVDRPRYEEGLTEQIERAVAKSGSGDLDALLNSGETWEVKA